MYTPLQLQKLGVAVAAAPLTESEHTSISRKAIGAVVKLTLSTANAANVDVLSASEDSLPGCRCLQLKVPSHPKVEKHVEV